MAPIYGSGFDPTPLAKTIVDYIRANASPVCSGLDTEQTVQRRLLDGRMAKLQVVTTSDNQQLKISFEPVRPDQWGVSSLEEWSAGGNPTGDFHYLEFLVGDQRSTEGTNACFSVYGEKNASGRTPTLIRDHAVALYHGVLRDLASLVESGDWRTE